MVPGTGPLVQGARGVKHKGMVQLKADLAAHDARMRDIRRNIERLSDLMRVCDYMMCASLLQVARAAVGTQHLEHDGARRCEREGGGGVRREGRLRTAGKGAGEGHAALLVHVAVPREFRWPRERAGVREAPHHVNPHARITCQGGAACQ